MRLTVTLPKSLITLVVLMLFSTGLATAQKTITIHPVKKDSTNTRKPNMNEYYPDTLFKFVNPPKKTTDPKLLEAQKLYNDATLKARDKDYQGAIELYSRSIALFESSDTYMKRGYSYLFKENYPLAIQDFTDALRLLASNKLALLGRGIAYFNLKDFNSAQADLGAYIDRDKKNPMAFNYMAAVCFKKQDYSCALANYDEVAKLDTTYTDLYNNRGMMRHYLRDFKGAVADYNNAIKLDSNSVSAHNNRAAAYMMLNDFQSALADLDIAIKLHPMYADAYDNRGRVKQKLGDMAGACQDWQTAFSMGLQSARDMIIKFCK